MLEQSQISCAVAALRRTEHLIADADIGDAVAELVDDAGHLEAGTARQIAAHHALPKLPVGWVDDVRCCGITSSVGRSTVRTSVFMSDLVPGMREAGGRAAKALRLIGGARVCALVLAAPLVVCARAAAEPVGFLYTVGGAGISEFAQNSDASLSALGSFDEGGATTTGSLVMAKVAGTENLYQMAGSAIRQFSVNVSTGQLTAKSPAELGSIPGVGYEEGPPVAVFNPAATGQPGQNALYVLSTKGEQAWLSIFDIDPANGTLTEAGEVEVQGIKFALSMAHSGNRLVINGQTGEGIGFQYAEIDAKTGIPVFPQIPDVPCKPFSCYDSRLHMLDPDHMLGSNIVEKPNSPSHASEWVAVGLEAGGAFTELGSNPTRGVGLGEITDNGNSYFSVTEVPEESVEAEQQGFEATEAGDWFVQQFSPDGLSEGTIQLPGHGDDLVAYDDIFALGSGLYVANPDASGIGFRLAPAQLPVEVNVPGRLGESMTGFLTGSAAELISFELPPAKSEVPPVKSTEGAKETPATTATGNLKSAVVKGTVIKLLLACAGATMSQCEVTGKLVVVEARKGSRIVGVQARRQVTHKRTVVVGQGSAKLGGGKTAVLQVNLNAAGKALLARFKTLQVELELTQQSGASTHSLKTEKLTLKAPKKHR